MLSFVSYQCHNFSRTFQSLFRRMYQIGGDIELLQFPTTWGLFVRICAGKSGSLQRLHLAFKIKPFLSIVGARSSNRCTLGL